LGLGLVNGEKPGAAPPQSGATVLFVKGLRL
jgi:hypothetical protein